MPPSPPDIPGRRRSFLWAWRKGFPALLCLAVCLLTIRAARATDVLYYELFKGQSFTQSGANNPVLATNDPYVFQVFVFPLGFPYYSETWDVTNPAVKIPAGTSLALTINSQTTNGGSRETNFVFAASASSQSALDATYGAGNYTLSYHGHYDGAASVVVPLGTDTFPPAAPFVSNLVAAQAVNVASNFTLSFAPWLAANSNDFVQLTIQDSNSNLVFSTTPLYAFYPQTALSATNSQIIISNGTLTAGQNYTATLTFTGLTSNNLYNFTGYPLVLAGFFSQTTFAIHTETAAQTIPPLPPASPTNLTDTLLTLTITNSTGPFDSSGVYQLFTTAMGSNFFVLGNAGGGFGSGGYVYTQTATNTGAVSFTDSAAGAVSLQVVFTSAGAGAFVLSSSQGVQEGFFTETPGYTAVNAPNIFLPSYAGGQFQAYISGDPGINYTVESSTNLTVWSVLTNVTIPDLTTNLNDTRPSAARFYRASVNSVGFAPGAITGQSFCCTITAGATPFPTNGIFQFDASTNGNDYQIIGGIGATNGSGGYTYSITGANTAQVSYTDSSSGATCYEQLVFTSAATGYFYTTNPASAGFQSGSFNMAAGPVLFLGNVKFTPDAARTGSVLFPANGTPVSLSVTDAGGYVWTLNIPSNALSLPTTISMAPFAGIDSSSSLLPVVSGVQLSPDGAEFEDGVLLTVTAPAALGSHAALAMADGGGANLYFVETTNQANSFSTTLFHFSSASAFDPSDAQWQQIQDQFHSQPGGVLDNAYQSALNGIASLDNKMVIPPEPPDLGFSCADDTVSSAAFSYNYSLFLAENNAIQNLLYVGAAYRYFTGSDPHADVENSLIRELIENSCYRKVDFLFTYYNTVPLKYLVVSLAAAHVDHWDKQYGGTGRPDWYAQLLAWVSGPVVDYYVNKVKNHDYTAATAVAPLQTEIVRQSGDPSAMLQRFAAALTFQLTLTISDIGDGLSIKAHGTVTVTGNPQYVFPISGGLGRLTNNCNYDSVSWGDCTI